MFVLLEAKQEKEEQIVPGSIICHTENSTGAMEECAVVLRAPHYSDFSPSYLQVFAYCFGTKTSTRYGINGSIYVYQSQIKDTN